MSRKHLRYGLLSVLAALATGASGRALLRNVLYDRPGLKVVASDTFPKDMACEVFVGSEKGYRVRFDGEGGRITSVATNINLDSSVIVLRRRTKNESYVLNLFATDSDGKVVSFYDLNCDGQWDVKLTPTREQKSFIRRSGQWLGVRSVEGLLSETPVATADGARYEFSAGAWLKKQASAASATGP